ncbi:DUF5085 family protein [Psychrobacillus sp. BL-248-WT-3]|uniref:DUF5085 family protein n=1 Tax=Psychrobacillus sp. BL-248-WT-3 TaxID=2725306 RepID=UPI00197CEE74|nr:DUF5085 family protein [Psychrobacillus sp. BL-248-WT-3]
MGIELCSLLFDNVLSFQVKDKKENWQEGIFELENFTLNNEVYKNGPIFFSYKEYDNDAETGLFNYYLPISTAVVLNEDAHFSFIEHLEVEKALLLRQAEQEVDFTAAYDKVKSYAIENDIELEDNYYCVLLDVYGEFIIDLYVPVIGQGAEK